MLHVRSRAAPSRKRKEQRKRKARERTISVQHKKIRPSLLLFRYPPLLAGVSAPSRINAADNGGGVGGCNRDRLFLSHQKRNVENVKKNVASPESALPFEKKSKKKSKKRPHFLVLSQAMPSRLNKSTRVSFSGRTCFELLFVSSAWTRAGRSGRVVNVGYHRARFAKIVSGCNHE
jgi:hypothetical protein